MPLERSVLFDTTSVLAAAEPGVWEPEARVAERIVEIAGPTPLYVVVRATSDLVKSAGARGVRPLLHVAAHVREPHAVPRDVAAREASRRRDTVLIAGRSAAVVLFSVANRRLAGVA